jgi:hypothetical protein
MEVNAMARRAEKHDSLDVMAMAIKRQQKKRAKQIKKLATANSWKLKLIQNPSRMNPLTKYKKPIPRKKKTTIVDLMDTDLSDDKVHSKPWSINSAFLVTHPTMKMK